MKNKVYYCSLFFNELALTKLKLEELWDVVDNFVISESNISHAGHPKEFIFDNNLELFKKYSKKIIYQKLTDDPTDFVNLKEDPAKGIWYNNVVGKINAHTHYPKTNLPYCLDSWQKESIIRALGQSDINDEDIVFLVDADEIVKPEIIERVQGKLSSDDLYRFDSDMFYYYLNLRKSEPWKSPIAMTFKKFRETSFCVARNFGEGRVFASSGYHFTYVGGVEKIKTKLENFGEQSLNQENIKSALPFMVENAISLGRDLFGRPCRFWQTPFTTEYLPKYLVENPDQFKDYLIYPLDKQG